MKSQYVLPITIVVAGALVAGAVFLVGQNSGSRPQSDGEVVVRPYDPASDHILGNPNATVKVIEYADLECQFCKEFHPTMHQIMEYYGKSGNVAWVFRHFPLVQLHAKAGREAEAAECAAEQGGSTSFFRFVDKVYEVTPSNNRLDLAQLPLIAGEVGLNVEAFNTCLASGKHAAAVAASYQEALAAGGKGTPYILITAGEEHITLSGAQPYDSMRAAIDAMLSQNTPTTPTQ